MNVDIFFISSFHLKGVEVQNSRCSLSSQIYNTALKMVPENGSPHPKPVHRYNALPNIMTKFSDYIETLFN